MKCPQCFFTDETPDDEICRPCSRNRTRTELVEVVLVGLVYLFLCRFAHYLFTGEFFDHPFRGGILFRLSGLGEAFRFPVSLSEHPWHVITVGWTFALVLAVPVLVAMCYGVVPGVVLAVVGSYHVPVPFLFVLIAVGAVFAGVRLHKRLRLEVILAAATGVPLVYMFLMMLGALSADLGVFAWLPWLVTVTLLVFSVWFVPWLLRRRDYNARFLVWVVALETLAVFALFYGSVGFAKVEYAFVRRKHSAKGPRFRIVVNAPGSVAEYDEARRMCEHRREEARDAFTRFIRWFPRAAETPLARFELAEIQNLCRRFTGNRPDQLVVSTFRITAEAREQYGIIRKEFATSPATVAARLKAARFHLQHAQSDEARPLGPLGLGERELRALVDYCSVKLPADYAPGEGKPVGDRWRRCLLNEEERRRLLYETGREARAELSFLERNSDYNRIPLMLYYQLDPREEGYADGLRRILTWFPECRLADNMELTLLTRRAFSPEALEALIAKYRALYARDPTAWDTGPSMLLTLGRLYVDRKRPEKARNVLETLQKAFPRTPEFTWATAILHELP